MKGFSYIPSMTGWGSILVLDSLSLWVVLHAQLFRIHGAKHVSKWVKQPCKQSKSSIWRRYSAKQSLVARPNPKRLSVPSRLPTSILSSKNLVIPKPITVNPQTHNPKMGIPKSCTRSNKGLGFRNNHSCNVLKYGQYRPKNSIVLNPGTPKKTPLSLRHTIIDPGQRGRGVGSEAAI